MEQYQIKTTPTTNKVWYSPTPQPPPPPPPPPPNPAWVEKQINQFVIMIPPNRSDPTEKATIFHNPPTCPCPHYGPLTCPTSESLLSSEVSPSERMRVHTRAWPRQQLETRHSRAPSAFMWNIISCHVASAPATPWSPRLPPSVPLPSFQSLSTNSKDKSTS